MAELMRALPFSSSSTSLSHTALQVDESILSLLLKLHSKLSNEPDSYRPGPVPDSRIGDGPFFIASVLNTYVKLNPSNGEKAVDKWRRKIWPRADENLNSPEKSDRESESGSDMGKNRRNELEERRRKAKERQQKLMAEFASRQKAFMKKMEMDKMNKDLDTDEAGDCPAAEDQTDSQASGASVLRPQEYECVICSQTTPSTNDKLIGMVALLQSTSVLAHATASSNIDIEHGDNVLPCDTEQINEQKERSTQASYVNFKVDEFSKNFSAVSWQKSLSIGWEGGVHVQSCGHYLHLACHKSYLLSLRSQSQASRSGLEQGDFSCPLCRQMANSVLPVIPETQGAISPSWLNDRSAMYTDVLSLLTNLDTPEKPLIQLLGSFMEDLTKATLPQYRSLQPSPTTQSLFLFLCSIVRTNLECDVLVRLSRSAPVGAKKASFGPLFKVLALNAKVFIQQPYNSLWTQLTGLPDLQMGMGLVQSGEKEVPLLLRDPIALMIQILFALPVNIDRAFFTTVVQALFNLSVTQSLAQLTCVIDNEQRSILKTLHQTQLLSAGAETFASSIQSFMGLLIETLEQGSIYQHLGDDSSNRKSWDVNRLVAAARSICLPFLRSAAVLQHHLYGIEYSCTDVSEGSPEELNDLMKLLSLNPPNNKSDFTSSVCWPIPSPSLVIELWCQEFNCMAQLLPVTAEVSYFVVSLSGHY
jgi:E3 ubiquitin-protein ligase UBR3